MPLIAGVAGGVQAFDRVPQVWGLCAAVASALAAAAAAASMADGSRHEATAALVVGAAAAGLSLGLSAARGAYGRALPVAAGEPVVLEGTLREDAVTTPAGAALTLDALRWSSPGREPATLDQRLGIRLGVAGASAAAAARMWRAGRTVRLTAIVRPPATYRNFGVPDEARALARRGIAAVGTVKSAALVEVVRRGGALPEAAAAARAWSRDRLTAQVGLHSSRSAAISTAILIGDRSGIPADDERRLQEAGTYHVIAISGGNIAMLTALALLALRTALLPPRAASAVTIGALLFYGYLTGAPPSVARAITAAIAYLAARVIDHRGPALNALAVAAVSAVALTPFAALDPGFVLSFGATLGILLGTPRLVRPAQRRVQPSRFARATRAGALHSGALLAATACAEAALLPVGAALFARVTFAGLLLNFLAIPLMTIVQSASILVLAAGAMPSVAAGAAYAAHLSAAGLVESARLVDVLPWLSRDVLPPAAVAVAAYYAAWLLLMYVRPIRGPAALAVALSTAWILFTPGPAHAGVPLPPSRGLLRVAFLDVGQADATLVRLPGGRSLLVDAGGLPGSTFDAGERVVAPALRALGVRRLEALVITHADPDHIGGAASIVRRYAPRAIWEGVPVPPDARLRELAELTAIQSGVWRTVQAGDVERADGVEIRIWHPPPPDWERQRVRNNDSIVLELRYGDISILLTGDIERDAERELAPRISLAPVVILKAPHHGSATSSTGALIEAARPAAAVVSAGRRNPFGHPHPDVLARYRAAHAAIFRTDDDGAIVVDSDGRTAEIRTFSGRRLRLSR